MIICLIIPISSQANNQSTLGLDYLQITKNQILTDIMLDLEPKLIVYYQKHHLKEVLIKQGVRGVASSFAKDITYKSVIDSVKNASPDSLLQLLKLPKTDYPMLWAIGEGERIERELDSSLKLYKALNGKEYIEN
jgi:hypothetical protein